MDAQIPRTDWLLRAPGLIRSAAVYSAFLIGDTLHFVRTGPGWQRPSAKYSAYSFITNPVIERQINRNRQALALMEGWNYRREVPERAEFSYSLDDLDKLLVSELGDGSMAQIKLSSTGGKPRRLSLESQDYLGDPHARRDFFSRIAITELR